jgi:hypothetical protein
MRPLLIVITNPHIEIGLRLVRCTVYLFAEHDAIKFIERGLVEAFTDAVGLRAVGLGARVIDVLDREVELISCRSGLLRYSLRDRSTCAAA